MTVKEICERLSNVDDIFNDKVYVIDYNNFKIKGYTLLGFYKTDEGDSNHRKYVKYATLEVSWPDKPLKVKIEDLYKDGESAKTVLNAYIQKQIDDLESKKL